MKDLLIATSCLLILLACGNRKNTTINLAGEWQFKMDEKDQGVKEKWYQQELEESVLLPGSMVENGKGNNISYDTEWTGGVKMPEWFKDPQYAPFTSLDNIRFPFWLQPEKKYTGAAWYRKKINIPTHWEGKDIQLVLERPHWESMLWVNGEYVGMQNSLAVPHLYSISSLFKTGENVLAIRIDNRTKDIDVGENSHSISDHTQSNWNGIVGELTLTAVEKIAIENVKVFPNIANQTVKIKVRVNNTLSEQKKVRLTALSQLKKTKKSSPEKTWEFELTPGENKLEMEYSMGKDIELWDEFTPHVYELSLSMHTGEAASETKVDFGFRDFKPNGPRFEVNGRPVFLRGTLECCIFPKTGYPPTETEYWRKIYTAIKSHGLNHVRFHSWCPPQAAFQVADELGVYLQVECSSWANESTRLGSGLPIDQYVWDESKRIIDTYGNHPSFVMMAYGNEPGGSKQSEFLTDFVEYWKQEDQRRVYTSGAGWPVLEANQFHNVPQPRIQRWGEGLKSLINSQPPKSNYDWTDKIIHKDIPVVSHEIGQWCAYPNFDEIEKYTGVLKAKNFELFRESLEANHMGDLSKRFLMASGKLQALCYKADIEAALRTPDFAGFQLLDLHDFPGQGTALVGVLDAFWEEKGYISPKEYSRFCNTTVPLARLEKHIFLEGETLNTGIEVAHFGPTPLNITPTWQLLQGEEVITEGAFKKQEIAIGNGIVLGEIKHQFQSTNTARKITLKVKVSDFENSWDIWVYPKSKEPIQSNKTKIIESIDASVLNHLQQGGQVLLSLGKGKVSQAMGGDVALGFSSIFWNTAWTGKQKPHTLGILCDPEHPALKLFPTEYHSNWQWWDALSHADAIQLDSLPVELKPIVQIIDDWFSNRRLALLLEVKVGAGSVLISGSDLVNNLTERPAAQQLRNSLISYMESPRFAPSVSIKIEELKKIVK